MKKKINNKRIDHMDYYSFNTKKCKKKGYAGVKWYMKIFKMCQRTPQV